MTAPKVTGTVTFDKKKDEYSWKIPNFTRTKYTSPMLFDSPMINVKDHEGRPTTLYISVQTKGDGFREDCLSVYLRSGSNEVLKFRYYLKFKLRFLPVYAIGLKECTLPAKGSVKYDLSGKKIYELAESVFTFTLKVKLGIRKTMNPLKSQSVGQPMSQSIGQPILQSLGHHTTESVNQPMLQSVDQPMLQSVDQPMLQSVDQPTSKSVDQPNIKSVNEPKSKEKPAAETEDTHITDVVTDLIILDDTNEIHPFDSKEAEDKVAHQMLADFGGMFLDSNLADCKIICKDEEFDCHMVILTARSLEFGSILKETKEICMKDIRPEIVKEMLKFIYTGRIENIEETGLELLKVAEQYKLHQLKEICESNLILRTDKTNGLDHLIIGDMYSASKLKAAAMDWVVNNIKTLVKTADWRQTSFSHPHLMSEVTEAIVAQRI